MSKIDNCDACLIKKRYGKFILFNSTSCCLWILGFLVCCRGCGKGNFRITINALLIWQVPVQVEGEANVVPHGKVWKEMGVLRNVADLLVPQVCHCGVVPVGKRKAIKKGLPGKRCQKTGQSKNISRRSRRKLARRE